MFLCVQFLFSAAAIHFLVRWISRLIALWSQGFNIPSLDFFSWEELDQFLRSLANEGLFNFFYNGSRDGAVVRALAFHQCGPGSIPGLDVICGLSLLLVLFSAPRGFSPGTPVFPSPQKPTFLNSNSIRNARAFNTWAPGSVDWATTPHVIELK